MCLYLILNLKKLQKKTEKSARYEKRAKKLNTTYFCKLPVLKNQKHKKQIIYSYVQRLRKKQRHVEEKIMS